ncbi:MAG: hypothetical protein WCO06_06700 [Candidatus Roizmanbacteria bacterium]
MKKIFLTTTNYIKNHIEKVLIGTLTIIFITVFVGAFWDLYGKNILTKQVIPVPTPTVSIISPQPTIPTNNQPQQNTNKKTNKPPKDEQVDITTFVSCMTGLTTKKACKDCCDGLSLDATMNDTCRKTCNKSISQ